MFPDDEDVQKVKQHMFDPFEYLLHRHKAGLLNTAFQKALGTVAWHVPCHQRVQNIGPKTRDVLNLIPDIEIDSIERCSGHDGTYGVKAETFDLAVKIGRPVANRIKKNEPDHFTSDCPIAGHHLANILGDENATTHPMSLLKMAYGLGE